MKTFAEKIMGLKRRAWTFCQPLTLTPVGAASPISDLFVWRSSDLWTTSFELMDIASLFEDGHDERWVTLVFFDQNGSCLGEKRVDLQPGCRQTVDISTLVGCSHGELGTFAVFHSSTPFAITKLGSFLAERGYVSYRYQLSPLGSYVHGNFDAISRGPDNQLLLLGGVSILKREYRLQYQFLPQEMYELALVNITSILQTLSYSLISASSGEVVVCKSIAIKPGAVALIPLKLDVVEAVRLVIKSNLVMARPLVFRIQNLKMDVFHG